MDEETQIQELSELIPELQSALLTSELTSAMKHGKSLDPVMTVHNLLAQSWEE
jgi:hypothetical protein